MEEYDVVEEARFDRMDHDLIQEEREQRYNKRFRRTLVDMRIRQVDPSYRVTPDEIVDISDPE